MGFPHGSEWDKSLPTPAPSSPRDRSVFVAREQRANIHPISNPPLARTRDTEPDKISTGGDTNQGKVLKCPRPGCPTETVFSRPHDLKRHELKHEPKVLYGCGCCFNQEGKTFPRKDHLTQHMRNVHGLGEKQQPACSCHTCKETQDGLDLDLLFPSVENYEEHCLQNHSGGPTDISALDANQDFPTAQSQCLCPFAPFQKSYSPPL